MTHFIRLLVAAALLFTTTSFALASPVLKSLQGRNIAFSSLKGKWVYINYWASWCESCLNEIPAFNRFARRNKNKAVVFAVNYDALPTRDQKRLVAQYNIKYPSLTTDPARALNLGDIRGVPMTFVFNPEGRLVKTLYGPQTAATLKRAMN